MCTCVVAHCGTLVGCTFAECMAPSYAHGGGSRWCHVDHICKVLSLVQGVHVGCTCSWSLFVYMCCVYGVVYMCGVVYMWCGVLVGRQLGSGAIRGKGAAPPILANSAFGFHVRYLYVYTESPYRYVYRIFILVILASAACRAGAVTCKGALPHYTQGAGAGCCVGPDIAPPVPPPSHPI